MIETLSRGTGIPFNRLEGTTLQSFRGVLFENVTINGATPFVLSLGLYHRIRRSFGSQYCPRCLDTEIPYARLTWRLAWNTCCEKHGCLLRDRCHACQHPYVFHRKGFQVCWYCGADLRGGPVVACDPEVLSLQGELRANLEDDWTLCSRTTAKHPLVAFNVIRDLMSLIAFGKRSAAFRSALDPTLAAATPVQLLIKPVVRGVERLDHEARHFVMKFLTIAIENWPARFVDGALKANLWRSWVHKDRRLSELPFPIATLFGRDIVPDHDSITGKKHLRSPDGPDTTVSSR